ncbi:ester cyclase [Pseudonocardia sp.]|uniref:ester cyclase n=1 Tax=Pseudonocardia sp. TaxID=60912 RepID=UPI002604FD51|nr:ester cyclase [Pseudonocardia sp.]
MTSDWVDHEASFEQVLGPLRGPACLLAVGAWLRTGFPDLRFVEQTMVGDDRHVISVMRLTGTNTGPLVRFRGGRVRSVVPPTGRRVDAPQSHIYELRDGAVVSHAAVRDDLGLLTQLGLLPPAPSGLARTAGWAVSGRSRRIAGEVVEKMRQAAAQLPDRRSVA